MKKMLMGAVLIAFSFSMNSEARETKWTTHGVEAKSRLIGTRTVAGSDKYVWLAWEAKLSDGWKTYWRSPGEAGLPVVVQMNNKDIDLAYPAPSRFTLFGMQTYGYSKKVIIPFQIEKAALKTGTKIEVSFMVCKDICVPIETSFQMPEMKMLDYDLKIENWLKKVPTRTGNSDIKIVDKRIVGPKGRQRVIVDVVGIENLEKADMLVEGPEGVNFSKPIMTNKGDRARFVIKASGMSDMPSLKGKQLRLTILGGDGKAIDRLLNF